MTKHTSSSPPAFPFGYTTPGSTSIFGQQNPPPAPRKNSKKGFKGYSFGATSTTPHKHRTGLKEVASHTWDHHVTEASGHVLVLFWTSAFGSSKDMIPIVRKAAKKYNIKAVTVDIVDNLDLAKKYQVREVPTVLLFYKGRKIDGVIGHVDETVFAKMANKHTTSSSPPQAPKKKKSTYSRTSSASSFAMTSPMSTPRRHFSTPQQ